MSVRCPKGKKCNGECTPYGKLYHPDDGGIKSQIICCHAKGVCKYVDTCPYRHVTPGTIGDMACIWDFYGKCYDHQLCIFNHNYNIKQKVINSISQNNNQWQNSYYIQKKENDKLKIQIQNLKNENILLKQQIDKLKNENLQNNDDIYGDKCRLKFVLWLCETVRLKQYLLKFEENESDDITMIEYFDEDLIKDIGIQNKVHKNKIMKKIEEFKNMVNEFKKWIQIHNEMQKYQKKIRK